MKTIQDSMREHAEQFGLLVSREDLLNWANIIDQIQQFLEDEDYDDVATMFAEVSDE